MNTFFSSLGDQWNALPYRYRVATLVSPFELKFITDIYMEWGPMMTSFIIIINASFIYAIYKLIPLLKEYEEKDFARDRARAQAIYNGVASVTHSAMVIAAMIITTLVISLSSKSYRFQNLKVATEEYYQSLLLKQGLRSS